MYTYQDWANASPFALPYWTLNGKTYAFMRWLDGAHVSRAGMQHTAAHKIGVLCPN
jgi:hypothetical protein